jgi:hypothetical protein
MKLERNRKVGIYYNQKFMDIGSMKHIKWKFFGS